MNRALVWRLVVKDWYLSRVPLTLIAMVVMGATNVAYSFAWLAIIRLGLLEGADSPVPIWSGRIVAILATEIAVIAAALALTFYLQSRKTNFV